MTVLIVAGETSGDLHGAALARAIRELAPDARIVGAGGERMAAAGVELLVTLEEISAFGFAEVIRRLPRLRRARSRLAFVLRTGEPDVFVPVDFGGMNLGLARIARAGGIPVVYFVSPQVWAWRTGRVETIRRVVDRMIVILPFEEAFYREHDIAVSYVGHPLLDEARPEVPRAEFRARLGVEPRGTLVALLPGSRGQEVRRHFPIQAQAASILAKRHAPIVFAAAASSSERAGQIRRLAAGREPVVNVVEGETDALLAAADVALVASGTATLQCAVHGTPMVVMYRVTPLEFAIARRMVRVPHIAMVNLIAEKPVVPELIQGGARPERVADEASRLITDPGAREAMKLELARVRASLGEGGAARRAAAIVLSFARGRDLVRS